MLIRAAALDDLEAVEGVRVATWQVAYRGIVPDDVLDGMVVTQERVAWLAERWADGAARTLVAVDGDEVIGMAVHGECRDADRSGERELYALYVLPSHWGGGAGQLLWDACQPVTSLWVLADNARARAFYARNGLVPEATKETTFGVPLTEVRYVLA